MPAVLPAVAYRRFPIRYVALATWAAFSDVMAGPSPPPPFHKPPSLPLPPPHAASTSTIAELAVSWRAPCTRLTGFIVTPSTICRTPIGRCWSMDSRRRAGLYWRRWTGPAGSLRTSGEWRFMTYRRRGGSPGRGAIAKMRAFDRLTHRQGLMADTLDDLGKRLERFASEREWQRFHSPKNLASA